MMQPTYTVEVYLSLTRNDSTCEDDGGDIAIVTTIGLGSQLTVFRATWLRSGIEVPDEVYGTFKNMDKIREAVQVKINEKMKGGE